MPIFLGIHNIGKELTEEEGRGIWARYQAAAKNHDAEGLKTYFNAKEGRAFCITEAKSAADVDAAHAELGLPTDELIEVQKFN